MQPACDTVGLDWTSGAICLFPFSFTKKKTARDACDVWRVLPALHGRHRQGDTRARGSVEHARGGVLRICCFAVLLRSRMMGGWKHGTGVNYKRKGRLTLLHGMQ
jgi:hypothetical protein